MSENIRNQLDEYVKLIEREVRGALERFEPLYLSSDMKVNIDFINDIKDVTINGYVTLTELPNTFRLFNNSIM